MDDRSIPKRKRPRPIPASVRALNDKVHAETQEQRNIALRLRLQGASYTQIAKQLGVSVGSAHNYVNDALAQIPRESAEALRAKELAKCDASELATNQRLLDPKITVTEFAKLQTVLSRIRQERARYEGTYAPEQHHHTLLDQTAPGNIRELSDEQLKRIASGDFSALATRAGGDGPGAGGAGAS